MESFNERTAFQESRAAILALLPMIATQRARLLVFADQSAMLAAQRQVAREVMYLTFQHPDTGVLMKKSKAGEIKSRMAAFVVTATVSGGTKEERKAAAEQLFWESDPEAVAWQDELNSAEALLDELKMQQADLDREATSCEKYLRSLESDVSAHQSLIGWLTAAQTARPEEATKSLIDAVVGPKIEALTTGIQSVGETAGALVALSLKEAAQATKEEMTTALHAVENELSARIQRIETSVATLEYNVTNKSHY